jgi:hypothetical protein
MSRPSRLSFTVSRQRHANISATASAMPSGIASMPLITPGGAHLGIKPSSSGTPAKSSTTAAAATSVVPSPRRRNVRRSQFPSARCGAVPSTTVSNRRHDAGERDEHEHDEQRRGEHERERETDHVDEHQRCDHDHARAVLADHPGEEQRQPAEAASHRHELQEAAQRIGEDERRYHERESRERQVHAAIELLAERADVVAPVRGHSDRRPSIARASVFSSA